MENKKIVDFQLDVFRLRGSVDELFTPKIRGHVEGRSLLVFAPGSDCPGGDLRRACGVVTRLERSGDDVFCDVDPVRIARTPGGSGRGHPGRTGIPR